MRKENEIDKIMIRMCNADRQSLTNGAAANKTVLLWNTMDAIYTVWAWTNNVKGAWIIRIEVRDETFPEQLLEMKFHYIVWQG